MTSKTRARFSDQRPVRPAWDCVLVAALVALLGPLPVCAGEAPRRIYFLESLTPTQPAAVSTMEAFRTCWTEKSPEDFETYIDFLELGRFPGQAHEESTARFLAGKYAQVP